MILRRFNFRVWWTRPVHLFDFILWWIIKLLWEPFSLKRSHGWHWIIRPLPFPVIRPLIVNGSGDDLERDTRWRKFYLTNFGWRRVVLIVPQVIKENGVMSEYTGYYQIGWNQLDNPKFKDNEFEMCTIIQHGIIGLLVGPGITNFFAHDLSGHPLELMFCQLSDRGKAPRLGIQFFNLITKKEALRRGYQIY
jgi:hypothetical protein